MRAYTILIGFTLVLMVLVGLLFLSWQIPEADIKAVIDVDPDTLNLEKYKGWVTVYVELPGYDITEINVETVRLWIGNSNLNATKWDFQKDKLMLKFDAADVINLIWAEIYHMGEPEWRDEVELAVTGALYDETTFRGTDVIQVIAPSP
jgi:hypothetical protein